MAEFTIGYYTDRGAVHEINQDSLFVKILNSSGHRALAAGVFDGMGGLTAGEKISGAAAKKLAAWVSANTQLIFGATDEQFKTVLSAVLDRLNDSICTYCRENGIEAGTTAALLFMTERHYIACNVGDSRVYIKSGNSVNQLTEDHSLVQQLVTAGLLTPAQAKRHPERSVLLQALGVMNKISPSYSFGDYAAGDSFLLCGDGFYNELTENELGALCSVNGGREVLNKALRRAADTALTRGETDNITGILIKTSK